MPSRLYDPTLFRPPTLSAPGAHQETQRLYHATFSTRGSVDKYRWRTMRNQDLSWRRAAYCTSKRFVLYCVLGINAITGGKRDEKPPNGLQDYVVGGKQPWLDGIATEPGVVRQFVAMKLGHGYTIEEQLSETKIGGIQIDVFPSVQGLVKFRRDPTQFPGFVLDQSPRQLAIKPKEKFVMTSTSVFLAGKAAVALTQLFVVNSL
ncbi:Integral membrane protein [Mycena sanguinolenta]|uniref:Integral membrane protein n=1 Tax=Mycena sanguinolenta TaxID=230812 RepID=A0A8H6YUG9_9AGAR|nr:Integral membrane protein [Mycena sanguinolenta]